MERSGDRAPGALHPTDLLEVYRSPGPFATVWAGASSPTPNDVRGEAKALTRAIGEPFDDVVRQEIEARLAERLTDAGGVVLVADPQGVRLVESLPEAPRRRLARVGALPSLSPVVEHRQADVPFVVVMADRQGADVYWSAPDDSGTTTVTTDPDEPISKVRHGGGWSHKRMQQRVEKTWEQTATEVADTIATVSTQIDPRVIAIGGDVRMVQLLRQHLPTSLAEKVREIPGGRSEDGSDELREGSVRRWVRTAVAEDTVALLQLFGREHGQHDRAADGPAATLAALRESRVDVLLVHDGDAGDAADVDGGSRGWFAVENPALVGDDPGLLQDLGVEPVAARLVDVAVRAALATGAGVRVVPKAAPITDGIGAVLRW